MEKQIKKDRFRVFEGSIQKKYLTVSWNTSMTLKAIFTKLIDSQDLCVSSVGESPVFFSWTSSSSSSLLENLYGL